METEVQHVETTQEVDAASEFYLCDYHCGFKGTFEEVTSHEQKCPMSPTGVEHEWQDMEFMSHTVNHVSRPRKQGWTWTDLFDGFKWFARDLTPAEVTKGVHKMIAKSDDLNATHVQERTVPVSIGTFSQPAEEEALPVPLNLSVRDIVRVDGDRIMTYTDHDEHHVTNVIEPDLLAVSHATCILCKKAVFPGQERGMSRLGMFHQACVLSDAAEGTFVGTCALCSKSIFSGQKFTFDRNDKQFIHHACMLRGARAFMR